MKSGEVSAALASLGARERELFELVCGMGEATAEEVRAAVPDRLTSSTIRTMLRLLESKGLLVHRQDGRTYVYRSAIAPRDAQRSILKRMIESFFEGSGLALVNAMLKDGTLTPAEVAELSRTVRDIRRGQP